MVRKTFCLIAAALFVATPTIVPHAHAQQVLDGIAAVVNGDVITFSQVRELVATRERTLREQYKGKELVDKIRDLRLSAVNSLVDRQLVLQEFKKINGNIPDYVVDERVQQVVREEFGNDRQAFVRTLEAQGYTLARFKEIQKEGIIVNSMTQRAIRSNSIIAPQQIDDYYRKNTEAYSSPEQIKLRMIVLKKEAGDDTGKKKMAQEIAQKLKDGAQFEQMAQMYSEDATQDQGGDWGWIDRKTLSEPLSGMAFKLKAGQVSDPIEHEGNIYLLFCEAKKKATVKPVSEVRGEIEKKLVQVERQQAHQKWIDGLRAKAYIKTY